MKEDKFESALDLKLFGEKRLLFNRMQELMKKHEEEFKANEENKQVICRKAVMEMLTN